MASQPKSLKLPPDLAEAAEIRAKQLGYISWNAYVKGLIRYDLYIQGPHSVTLPISQQRPEDQDKTDADLLERCKSGVGARGQWLERAITRVAGAEGHEKIGKQIGKVRDDTAADV